MATGTEMLLVTMLKTFVPKEAAEEIANFLERAIQDGTFTQIARLPQELAEIKAALARIESRENALHSNSGGSGLDPASLGEHGRLAITGPSNIEGTSCAVDAGRERLTGTG
jgi:hypothetical protein